MVDVGEDGVFHCKLVAAWPVTASGYRRPLFSITGVVGSVDQTFVGSSCCTANGTVRPSMTSAGGASSMARLVATNVYASSREGTKYPVHPGPLAAGA